MDKDIRVRISTKADTKAIDTTSKRIADLGSKAKTTTNSVKGLDNSVGSFVKKTAKDAVSDLTKLAAGYLAVSTAIDTVKSSVAKLDDITNLDGRLKLVTKSTQEFNQTQKDLLTLSNDARVKLTGTVDLYTRLKRSTDELNKSNKDVLNVTDIINKSIIVSGSSATESSAALTQLGQGLGSGVLRGEEFNSVMEQTTRLAKTIADGMGVGTNKLREMANEGELTSEAVFNAIKSQKDVIEKEFVQMPTTVAQSFTVMDNNMTVFLKGLDKKWDITKSISNKVEDVSNALANNSEELIGVIDGTVTLGKVTVGTIVALKTYNGLMAASVVLHSRLTAALVLAAVEQKAFNLLVKANPYILAATAIYGLIKALDYYKDRQKEIAQNAKEYALLLKERERPTYKLQQAQERILEVENNIRRIQESKSALVKNNTIDETKKALILKTQAEALKTQKEELENLNKKVKEYKNTSDYLESPSYKSDLKQRQIELEKEKSLLTEYYEYTENKQKIWEAKKLEIKEKYAKLGDDKVKTALDVAYNKIFKDETKNLEELNKVLLEVKQVGMSGYEKSLVSIKEKSREWQRAGVSVNEALAAQNILIDQLNVKTSINTAKEDLSYYERKVQLQNDSLEKEIELANITRAKNVLDINDNDSLSIERKQQLITLEDELYAKTVERLRLDNFNFEINFDVAGLDGTAKSIKSISDAFKELGKNNKAWDEYNKGLKDSDKDSKKYAKAQDKYFSNQVEGYSALAGAAAGMFEEQSTGYKVLTALQIGLQLANQAVALSEMFKAEAATASAAAGVTAATANTAASMTEAGANATAAIANQGKGDPYSAFARIAAMIALMGTVMTMFSSGGSSSSSSGTSTPSVSSGMNFDVNRDIINDTYDPMIDRLDDQIDLLKSIDKNGSASQLGIEKAVLSFEQDYSVYVEDILEMARQGYVNSAMSAEQTANAAAARNSAIGVDVFTASGGTIKINNDVLREGFNLLDTLIYYANNPTKYSGPLFQDAALEAGYSFAEMQSYVAQQVTIAISEIQGFISDWTSEIISSMDDLTDAADDFKGYFDDITGTTYYATKTLRESFSDVSSLAEGSDVASYLKNTINIIESLDSFLTDDKINLLLSSNADDLKAQQQLLIELGNITNETFDAGAREALDYIDSIELVSEAMITSRENIKEWTDYFKTDEELARDLASALGRGLAGSYNQLQAQYNQMANDLFGLTDADLEYLQAARDVIISKNEELLNEQSDLYNDYLSEVQSDISTLESSFSSLSNIIDDLRDSSSSSEYTLSQFWASIDNASTLLANGDYENLTDAISDISNYSSAVKDTSNFNNARDMQFAQLVAANKLESIDNVMLDEIDYLGGIEENTQGIIDKLDEILNNEYSLLTYGGSIPTFVDGSHADGLSYVPFDGYVAELHKGERVLTANDNNVMPQLLNEVKRLNSKVEDLQNTNQAMALYIQEQSEIAKRAEMKEKIA